MSNSLHIMIVESSQVIREGLASILTRSIPGCVIRQMSTFAELEHVGFTSKRGIFIINPTFIQYNQKLYNMLRAELPGSRWIAFTYILHDPQLLSLFDGVIHITDTSDSIIHLISRVHSSDSPRENPTDEILSEREKDVLQLLAVGLSNKEIADRLNISINTVITHRKNLSQKTGIRSVSGLTIYAVVNKLITLNSLQ